MKRTLSQASESPFRPEIEGLRGLAVGLVVAAHAGLQIPGAALGPDIFFVLSGYLIVGILLRGLEAGQGIRFRDFYARRIRRIAPALAATILLTVGVVALLNDPSTLARTAKDGAAALAGAANITFGAQAVDYFSSTEPSPLLPLWSIGVEEQFYLVVPLLLGIAWKIGQRRAILLTLSVIAVGSTAAAVLLTPTEPIWAYYLLPTRAYGLAAGGLLALLETRALASNALRRVPLAPIGLVMIAALTLLLPGEKGYPGLAGPLSGVASVALIGGMASIGLRGTVSATGGKAMRALFSIAPLRAIGRISYSLYLVHWPILILPTYFGVEMTSSTTLLAVVSSLLAATLMYRFVEQPFRKGLALSLIPGTVLRRGGAVLASLVLVLAGVGFAPDAASAEPGASDDPGVSIVTPTPSPSMELVSPSPTPWAPISIGGTTVHQLTGAVPANIKPTLGRAAGDADNILNKGCSRDHYGETVPVCYYGTKGGTRIVLLGDSHALHWMPALDLIGKAYNYEIIPVAKVNCVFMDVKLYAYRLGKSYTSCTKWRLNAIKKIIELNPALVILSQTEAREEGKPNEKRPQYYADAVGRLLDKLPVPVLIFAETPNGEINIPTCLARNKSNVAKCVTTKPDVYPAWGYGRDLLVAEQRNLPLFDFTAALCPGDRCAPIIDGRIVFHDNHHLTTTMAKYLAGPIGVALAQVIANLRH
ncbi:acyltransferase [bacterium]|nr:acyltransferase [bacterium]